ncbi:MAG: PilZ domain-containing protein [Reinekea sp.]|nr:PilZ domain-containing protein [Reinekea sp.]
MIKQRKQNRRYHRIQLKAAVTLTTANGVSVPCQCIDFSEDGIDLATLSIESRFSDYAVAAGSVVTLQIDGVSEGPTLRAAVIRAAAHTLGLRFL